MSRIVIENRSSFTDFGATARVAMYIANCKEQAVTNCNKERVLDIERKAMTADETVYIVRDVKM